MHKDFESHTEESMTLSTDVMSTAFVKQKSNTKSFTKAESVEADDITSDAFQMRNFSNAQGHKVKNNASHQNNESATLSKNND